MSVDRAFMNRLDTHPFKIGVRAMLYNHFEPDLADRFVLTYEAQKYNLDNNKSIQKQRADDNFILEVWYAEKQGLITEFICDLFSWEPKNKCEARLLRGITDKAKVGKIGRDWAERKGGVIGISQDILQGKYETKVSN